MVIESAILAGGKNSRYGGHNKAFIKVDGEQIILRNIKVLRSHFSKISIITNSPDQFSGFDYSLVPDSFTNIGPLGGIHAALKNSQSDWVFISSCDMPFLDSSLIDVLKNSIGYNSEIQAIVPRVEDGIEPLFAMYRSDLQSFVEDYIESNQPRAVHKLLNQCNVKYVDLNKSDMVLRAFTNINRPEDLSKLGF